MNSTNIIGTLTRDVELSYTTGGTAVAKIGIAWNEKRKDASSQLVEKAHFFDVTFFGRNAETLNQYVRKGQRIGITGKLNQDQWTAQDGSKRSKVYIVGERFDFIERAGQTGGQAGGQAGGHAAHRQPAPPQQQPPPVHHETVPQVDIDEEEIPF